MGWFSGGDKDKKSNGGNGGNGGNGQSGSNGKTRTATNAPRHWPQVAIDTWVPDNPAITYITLAAALNKGVQALGGSLALHQERLYDDGMLIIPIVVIEGEQRTAVFAYPRVDAAAASHFSGARSLLRQREGINAVYYAPEPIQPASPANVLKGVDTPYFHRAGKQRPPADYALWWPTPGDASFATSAALKHLDRWFEALDGYAAYAFTGFVRSLNMAEEPAGAPPRVYGLPETALMVPVDAPSDLRAYLHASQTQGLWIALDVTTPAARRDTLLKLLADLGEHMRKTAEGHRLPAHEQGLVASWWRAARAEALAKEAAGGADLRIGLIADGASTRRLEADPSTAEERGARKAANAAPDPELVECAGVLMDRATMMAGRAFGDAPDDKVPAPGEPAPPSIPAMLSMRTGADTWTVMFWDDDTPEAMDAARDLIAEHGAVDIAAFACDVLLNTGAGSKTDALFVRVQSRGDDSSHAFAQRYVPRRRGQAFGLNGRWVLVGREQSIYPPGSPSSTNGATPSERAIETAHKSLDMALEYVTFDDPTGAESLQRKADENRPLFMPRMLLDGGEQPGNMIMFGLMGAAAGRLSARRAARESDQRIAAFWFDHVQLKNGEPHREVRVVVHERGTPHAFLFAQGYQLPRAGTTFTNDAIRLIGPVSPLFAD